MSAGGPHGYKRFRRSIKNFLRQREPRFSTIWMGPKHIERQKAVVTKHRLTFADGSQQITAAMGLESALANVSQERPLIGHERIHELQDQTKA